tara:strand:+ start:227 stop:475 length:249 start_codon:yes stop_codon:yes gene_type:complete
MSLLTMINGIPLFSTSVEALAWAVNNGLQGFHTHQYAGQTGYMGGVNHNNAITAIPTITNTPTPRPTTNTPSVRRSGGGGGY